MLADVSDEPVELGEPGDYMVPLEVEGLPEGALAIDFYEDQPRVVIRDAIVERTKTYPNTHAITIEPVSHNHE